jgi:hypothetical protein
MHSFNHLSIDQKMALIAHCIEKYFYSVGFLSPRLEYADEAFERAAPNRYLISIIEFFADSNEAVLIYTIFNEIYDFVIDRNWITAEADHIFHASRVIDLVKQSASIKVRKDVTAKQGFANILTAEA